MSNKLFIPKSTLKGIADAIRAKTGDSGAIKVKNMPAAIQNIPGGGVPLETVLTGTFRTFPDRQQVDIKLIVKYKKGYTTLETPLKNMPIRFKLYDADTGEIIIENDTTDGSGEAYRAWTVPEIEKVEVDLPDPAPFTPQSLSYDNSILTVVGTSRDVWIQPVKLDDLLTVDTVKGVVIDNSTGDIHYTTDKDEWRIQYRGCNIDSFNGDDRMWEDILSVDFPETITSFPDESPFRWNSTIQMVTFRGISEIPEEAFMDCHNLKAVRINHNCSKIGYDAFKGTENLKHINIPALQESEGGILPTYYPEYELNSFILDSGLNINVSSQFEAINVIKNCVLAGYTRKEEENLCYDTYWYDNDVENVYFNDDTLTIPSYSADSFSNVNSVVIPVCTEFIEDNAFMDLSFKHHGTMIFEGLIPPCFDSFDSVFPSSNDFNILVPRLTADKYIDYFAEMGITNVYMFPHENMYGMYRITIIGETLTSTSNTPFNLRELGEYDNYMFIDEVEQHDTYDGGKLDYAFEGYGYHTLRSTNGFTVVNPQAFKNNQEITSFLFPNRLERIEAEAFSNCRNIESLVFFNEPSYIADDAFNNLHPECKVYCPEDSVIHFEKVAALKDYEIIGFKERD